MAELPWDLRAGFTYPINEFFGAQLMDGSFNVLGEKLVATTEDLNRWNAEGGIIKDVVRLPLGVAEQRDQGIQILPEDLKSTTRRVGEDTVCVYRDPFVSILSHCDGVESQS